MHKHEWNHFHDNGHIKLERPIRYCWGCDKVEEKQDGYWVRLPIKASHMVIMISNG